MKPWSISEFQQFFIGKKSLLNMTNHGLNRPRRGQTLVAIFQNLESTLVEVAPQ